MQLPAGARLFVNDVLVPQTAGPRTFDTPRLQAGFEYTYTLKAEVVRDGRPQSATRKITFEAGKPVSVDFRDMVAVSTASR